MHTIRVLAKPHVEALLCGFPSKFDKIKGMEYLLPIILAMIAGFATAAQGPTNAALGHLVGVVQASLVSFAGGLIVLGLMCPFFGQGDFFAIVTAQPWKWMGGLYGVFIVFTMAYCTPHLGAALCLTLMMLGQLMGAMVIDAFGLLETARVEITLLRFFGCMCVLLGIILVYISQIKGSNKDQTSLKSASRITLLCIVLSFTSGIASAVQTPTNAAMSSVIGTLESSTLNFIVGFAILLVVTLITNKGHITPMRNIEAWKFTGGVYGAIGVPCITIATPALGVSLALCCLMVAQLVGAIFVDTFGWFSTKKIKVDYLRVLGAIAVGIGVILVTISKL